MKEHFLSASDRSRRRAPRRADAPTELRLTTLTPGADQPRHTATLAVNSDGLFDVTDLVA